MSAELNRATIFNDTKWLYYCLCEGCGIGPMSPLVASDVKELCIHSTCNTASIGGDDGLCNMIENCLCLTEQCAFPPAAQTYPCICFNKKFGAERATGTKSSQNIFDMAQVMNDTFWIYYLFCYGCGINKCKGPLVQGEFKELCCAGSVGMVAPIEDGIFCSAISTELCIWSEFQLPPAPGNPKCAICTWRMSKDQAIAAPNKPTMPPTTQKGPAQVQMG